MQKVLRKEKSDMKPRMDRLITKFRDGEMLTRQQVSECLEIQINSVNSYLNVLSRYGLWIQKEQIKGSKKFLYKVRCSNEKRS